MTNIIGVTKYDTVHLFHNEIKSNTIEVHSNIGGNQHGCIKLVVRPTDYVLLSNTPFVHPDHPGTLVIPVVATLLAQDELKRQYGENLRIFQKTRGVERALI